MRSEPPDENEFAHTLYMIYVQGVEDAFSCAMKNAMNGEADIVNDVISTWVASYKKLAGEEKKLAGEEENCSGSAKESANLPGRQFSRQNCEHRRQSCE